MVRRSAKASSPIPLHGDGQIPSQLDSQRSGRRRVIQLQPVPAGRLLTVYLTLCLALVGLAGRMAWLQVKEGDRLQQRARAIQTQKTKPIGKRRPIVDRRGRLVALDEERFTLWAHPRYFNFPGDDPNLIRTSSETA